MNATAITVTRDGCAREWPGLGTVKISGRVFKRAADVQRAWFDGVLEVRTPYFFFVDDDDDLPSDYARIIDQCIACDVAVAYTDELIAGARRKRGDYSQAAHLSNPTLVHHMALCRTDLALQAIDALPCGDFWPEMLLFWQLAKLGGARHVDEVGYHWNQSDTGLHRWSWTVRGIHNSVMWCRGNP